MNALVTGAPMADTLALVLRALAARFTECFAGIWIARHETEDAGLLTLATDIGLPQGASSLDNMPGSVTIQEWEQRLRDDGITPIDWVSIRNTKDRPVGWLGLNFPPGRALSPGEFKIIEQYARVSGLIIEKDQLDQENHFLAYYDYLTEVPNRRLFHMRLAKGIEDAMHSHHPLSLVLLDLDNFKQINDTYGHIAGDEVLQEVARRMVRTLPHNHTVARTGGDEFALILTEAGGSQARIITNQVLEAIRHPIPWDVELFVSASAGIVVCPDQGTNEEELLRHADAALYRAKKADQSGGNLDASR